VSWARARHGTAGLTVPQARHGPSKLNRAVPGQESRHGVLARHGTRSRRAVPGHGGTVPCSGVPVPGRHGTPKWTCIARSNTSWRTNIIRADPRLAVAAMHGGKLRIRTGQPRWSMVASGSVFFFPPIMVFLEIALFKYSSVVLKGCLNRKPCSRQARVFVSSSSL